MATVTQLNPPGVKRRQEVFDRPEDYQITPELRKWAAERGITRLDDRLEFFADYCENRKHPYTNWQAAFRNSCRQDWAKLGMPIQPTRCARCRNPITGGWIARQDGRVCDDCDRQGRL